MPSTAVSQIIFFIASIVVATMVVGGLFVVTQDFTDALEDRGHTNAEKLRTRILIVNDPVAMPYNNTTGELHVYVKNIGMREIGMGSIAILLDGRPATISDVSLLNGTDWEPGRTVDVNVTATLDPGDHEMMVIVEYGASDRMTFRIG